MGHGFVFATLVRPAGARDNLIPREVESATYSPRSCLRFCCAWYSAPADGRYGRTRSRERQRERPEPVPVGDAYRPVRAGLKPDRLVIVVRPGRFELPTHGLGSAPTASIRASTCDFGIGIRHVVRVTSLCLTRFRVMSGVTRSLVSAAKATVVIRFRLPLPGAVDQGAGTGAQLLAAAGIVAAGVESAARGLPGKG